MKAHRHTGTEAPRGGMLLVLALVFASQAFGDDVGNTPASAELLSTGTVTRVFERREDIDVFQFTVLPFVTNRITVTTGTVWDVEMDLLAPSGLTITHFTNTAVGVPTTLELVGTTVARRAYLAVKSLAEFTTGSYHMAFARAFNDTDGDGLPDAWELARFGSLTNAWTGGDADSDGMTDNAEWLAGTNPADAASALRITQIQIVTNWAHVTWTTQPDGLYRLSTAPSPTGMWSAFPSAVLANSTLTAHPVTNAVTNAVFRVEFVY